MKELEIEWMILWQNEINLRLNEWMTLRINEWNELKNKWMKWTYEIHFCFSWGGNCSL